MGDYFLYFLPWTSLTFIIIKRMLLCLQKFICLYTLPKWFQYWKWNKLITSQIRRVISKSIMWILACQGAKFPNQELLNWIKGAADSEPGNVLWFHAQYAELSLYYDLSAWSQEQSVFWFTSCNAPVAKDGCPLKGGRNPLCWAPYKYVFHIFI